MIGSKNPFHRDLGGYTYCPDTGKRQFRTKGEAEKVIRQIKKKRKGDGSVYLCTHCGYWHTTSEDWQMSKNRRQCITRRKIEAEMHRPHSTKAVDPYTLIRIEEAKAELAKPIEQATEPTPAPVINNQKSSIMKIFLDTENVGTTICIDILKNEDQPDTMRLSVFTRNADGAAYSNNEINIHLTGEQVTELREAITIQQNHMKR